MQSLRALRPLQGSSTALRRAVLSRPYSSSNVPSSENPNPANDPTPRQHPSPVSKTNEALTSSEGSFDKLLQESVEKGEELRVQAPNRKNKGIWSPSQQPRDQAMVGPRFEQTIFYDQPRPWSAAELIHQQPVRWTKERSVSCDGGGGPLGHPRIFINVDKPEISSCNYCGLPFAHEHHRKHLEAQPDNPYPLDPTGDPAEVPESQRVTDEGFGQR